MKLVRRRYPWRVRNTEIALGVRTLIIGVLDAGPRAPSEKGVDPEAAVERALKMQDHGAGLIDVNAGVLGQGIERVSADDELRCLVPILRRLRHNLDIPISVNTYNAETAERALELGAQIINDISGLSFDPRLARVVNQKDAGLILTHMRGTPSTWSKLPPVADLIGMIARDLESAVARARGAGIDRRRIVVDPGLELGKRGLENYRILSELGRLAGLQQPILVSPSRKHFLTESVRAPESQWLFGAAAAVTVAICAGAHIVRVHEVEALAQVVQVADRFLQAAE